MCLLFKFEIKVIKESGDRCLCVSGGASFVGTIIRVKNTVVVQTLLQDNLQAPTEGRGIWRLSV